MRGGVGRAVDQPRLHDDRHEGIRPQIALERERERGRAWQLRGRLRIKLLTCRILIVVGLVDAEPVKD